MLTDDQMNVVFARIEDLSFLQGKHRDEIIDEIAKEYSAPKEKAREWYNIAVKRWRENQDGEDLTDRHYQLTRMAHSLYGHAINGVKIEQIHAIADDLEKALENPEETRRLIAQLRACKAPDIRTAQRILWNMAAMAGMGNKVTVDLSNVNFTPPTKPAAPVAASGEPSKQ